jgi:hypothetical protein
MEGNLEESGKDCKAEKLQLTPAIRNCGLSTSSQLQIKILALNF